MAHFATNCPLNKSKETDDKSDRKGKKPKPSARLVPDVATELYRAWDKVRDQTMLVFFDPGACANFISLELASNLGIHAKEMGMMGEASLACPSHKEPVTLEDFHVVPLEGYDVLWDIPWCYRLHAVLNTYNKRSGRLVCLMSSLEASLFQLLQLLLFLL